MGLHKQSLAESLAIHYQYQQAAMMFCNEKPPATLKLFACYCAMDHEGSGHVCRTIHTDLCCDGEGHPSDAPNVAAVARSLFAAMLRGPQRDLAQAICTAIITRDVILLEDVAFKYDRYVGLDDWLVLMLLRIKQYIERTLQ